MTEPSVEEIEALIADFESYVGDYPGKRIDWTVEVVPMRTLIASWRERGTVLGHVRQAIVREYPAHSQYGTKAALLEKIDAAIEGRP